MPDYKEMYLTLLRLGAAAGIRTWLFYTSPTQR